MTLIGHGEKERERERYNTPGEGEGGVASVCVGHVSRVSALYILIASVVSSTELEGLV